MAWRCTWSPSDLRRQKVPACRSAWRASRARGGFGDTLCAWAAALAHDAAQHRAPELELDPAFDRALDSDLDPAFD